RRLPPRRWRLQVTRERRSIPGAPCPVVALRPSHAPYRVTLAPARVGQEVESLAAGEDPAPDLLRGREGRSRCPPCGTDQARQIHPALQPVSAPLYGKIL